MDNQNEPLHTYSLEIEEIQKQLSQIVNDPDVAMLECHCIDLKGLETGIIRSKEEHDDACRKCPVYIDFTARNPKHIPNYN